MKRLLRAHGAALALAGLLLAVTSTALGVATAVGAAPGPPPAYVTDYANYPANAGVPDGCDSSGVTGVSFSLNGSDPVSDMELLPPVQEGGNQVTMTWTGVAPACDNAPIVLVLKDAPAPEFDPGALQPAVSPFEGQTLVAGAGGTMTFTLPSLADLRPDADCFYQLDAILGAPLEVVGPLPNGNFYSTALRGGGPNLLISSKNGGYETCTPTTPTTPTTSPSTTTTLPQTFQFVGATTVCRVEVPTIVITFEDQFPTLAGRTGSLTMSDVNGNPVSTQPVVYQPNSSVELLYPGTRVNADGTIADVPGWNLNEFGFWVRDQSDAVLREGINLTYTVNPTATAFVTYPPESSACANPDGPFPPGETPPPVQGASPVAGSRTLAATGATTPWGAFAGIFAVGLGVLLLVAGGRRHLAHTDRSSRSS